MTEQLGEIEKPSADRFAEGRKLFFVPLILAPANAEAELHEMVRRYWEQAREQIRNLEAKLGDISQVYHEMIPVGGEAGAKAIQELSSESYYIVRGGLDKGAALQAIEDGDLLTELMDWSRCLAVGLENEGVFSKVYGFLADVERRRNEHIARQIDGTLCGGKVGVLVMREGHGVQFASDIQVFYVAPPTLDEIKRWVRNWQEEVRRQAEAKAEAPSTGEAGERSEETARDMPESGADTQDKGDVEAQP